ncbi:MAG: hypothetical protein ACOX6T_06015 [Myxococcales bacterium]|jgi:hypothetical protein
MTSGRIHRKGTTATSWESWLVTASRSTEGVAARAIHWMRSGHGGAGAVSPQGSDEAAGSGLRRAKVTATAAAPAA